MAAKGEERRLARSAARLAAVQALFQMEATKADWREVLEEFETHRLGAEIEGEALRAPDLGLLRALIEGAVSRQAQIDQATDAALKESWPIGRIDPTLRALFRAAGAELFDMTDTPPKVVISEFVDVAKAFFPGGKEPGLVNAVLDRLARQARPEAFA